MGRPKKGGPRTELEKLKEENLRLRAENDLLKKSQGLSGSKKQTQKREWAIAIQELRQKYDLKLLLSISGMAYSTFYYHYKHFGRPDKYEHLKIRIQRIFDCHKGRYGYRRITATLLMEGIRVNHKTVKRLMDELGLKVLLE